MGALSPKSPKGSDLRPKKVISPKGKNLRPKKVAGVFKIKKINP
jgi:molybdopterin biosynthesis enzyme